MGNPDDEYEVGTCLGSLEEDGCQVALCVLTSGGIGMEESLTKAGKQEHCELTQPMHVISMRFSQGDSEDELMEEISDMVQRTCEGGWEAIADIEDALQSHVHNILHPEDLEWDQEQCA